MEYRITLQEVFYSKWFRTLPCCAVCVQWSPNQKSSLLLFPHFLTGFPPPAYTKSKPLKVENIHEIYVHINCFTLIRCFERLAQFLWHLQKTNTSAYYSAKRLQTNKFRGKMRRGKKWLLFGRFFYMAPVWLHTLVKQLWEGEIGGGSGATCQQSAGGAVSASRHHPRLPSPKSKP